MIQVFQTKKASHLNTPAILKLKMILEVKIMFNSNGKKIAMRTLAVILAVVMSVTMLAFSASAEDTAVEATEQVYVWAPLKDLHETFNEEELNPAELNPEFSWEVMDRRYDRDDRYVCTEYSINGSYGAFTVPSDSPLHTADKYAKGGLYDNINCNAQIVSEPRKNQLVCKVRQFTDMYLAFTAPEDGYYTLQADIMIRNATSSLPVNGFVYAAKVDVSTGNETMLKGFEKVGTTGANVCEADIAGADLKAGDQIILGASCTGGTAIVTVYDMRVSLNSTVLSKDKSTVTTTYNFLGSDRSAMLGQTRPIGSGQIITNATPSDKLWNYKAFYQTADSNAYAQEVNFANPFVASHVNEISSKGQFTGITAVNDSVHFFYNLDEAIYGTGPIVRARLNGANRYGVRFYFEVPEDGTAVIQGAYSLVNGAAKSKAFYRTGIIRKEPNVEKVTENGDGTKIEYLHSHIGLRYTAKEDAARHKFGSVKAGDII